MGTPITNPYNKLGNNCIGCSSNNPIGLQLNFTEYDDHLKAFWKPKKDYEGFHNVLHGGIQATLLDEIAAWVVFVKCKTAGVTQAMQIKYLAPVLIEDSKLELSGSLIKTTDKTALIKSELFNSEGKLCAEAKVEYYIFPEAVAKRKYNYPGIEAFYAE
jgi:uncharacterized protein (TIGR00369 family)